MKLWSEMKVFIWNILVLISSSFPLPSDFLSIFSFGWRIYYSCYSLTLGVSTSTRFEVWKFNIREVGIEMRQLSLETPFLGEHFILVHAYGWIRPGVKYMLTQDCSVYDSYTHACQLGERLENMSLQWVYAQGVLYYHMLRSMLGKNEFRENPHRKRVAPLRCSSFHFNTKIGFRGCY